MIGTVLLLSRVCARLQLSAPADGDEGSKDILEADPWLGWKEGIEFIFHLDIYQYERIAAAAPGMPADPIGSAYAQRVATPWLAGAWGELL